MKKNEKTFIKIKGKKVRLYKQIRIDFPNNSSMFLAATKENIKKIEDIFWKSFK